MDEPAPVREGDDGGVPVESLGGTSGWTHHTLSLNLLPTTWPMLRRLRMSRQRIR